MSLSTMTPVNVRALRPGDRLARAVFSRDGAKLLPRGTMLTPGLCATLRGYDGAALFYAVAAPRLGRLVGEDRSVVGELIEEKPSRRVSVREADLILAERSERWDELPLEVERGVEPVVRFDAPGEARLDMARWPMPDDLARFREERLAGLRVTLEDLTEGALTDLNDAGELVDEMIALLRAFPERFARLALLGERRLEYLAEHAFATAALSVAIAARMGCGETDARRAGLTGLLCDSGMALLPPDLRLADRRLDEVDVNRVRRHPTLSAASLTRVGGVDERVVRAVYQHHERADGSGYPACLRGRAICDLAKIAAVAETFAAATAFRPYRLAMKRPHDAMVEVVRLAGAGKLDRAAARALVEIAGLFPVGSWVRLTTGRRALVVGANPEAPTRPVVRVLGSDGALLEPLDLLAEGEGALRIASGADAPEGREMRALAVAA